MRNSYLKESSGEIKEQVKLLLKAAGVGNKLPTPKEDIVACSELAEIGQLDLSEYKESLFKQGINIVEAVFSKIKGFLDFRQKIIYVDPNIHPSRRTFVTYHEVSHRILPWHEGLYNPHIDTEYSLDPNVAQGLEMEANSGASLIQFQLDRFKNQLKDLPFGLKSAIYLAQMYEASLHSTFRKYVEDNHKECALLVFNCLNGITTKEMPPLELWYFIQSDKFTDELGIINWPKLYNLGNPIYDAVHKNPLGMVGEGEMLLDNAGTKKKCIIEGFYNNYNHFALVFPMSKLSLKKRRIIIENKSSTLLKNKPMIGTN